MMDRGVQGGYLACTPCGKSVFGTIITRTVRKKVIDAALWHFLSTALQTTIRIQRKRRGIACVNTESDDNNTLNLDSSNRDSIQHRFWMIVRLRDAPSRLLATGMTNVTYLRQ